MNLPTVEDELWLGTLPLELRARLERLFYNRDTIHDLIEDSYARGRRHGIEDERRRYIQEGPSAEA